MRTKSLSKAEAAYGFIKAAIVRCSLEPGQTITEEELSERFGISRAVVRPALKRLYQEHLVLAPSLRRYLIAPITLNEAEDVFEMRLLLEPLAARKAAAGIGAEALRRLAELGRIHYDPGDRDSAAVFVTANTEFHLTIARASGNDQLANTIAAMLDRNQRYIHLSHLYSDRNRAATDEHARLVEALASRDGQLAERVMHQQILAAKKFITDTMIASRSVREVSIRVAASAS